MLGIKYWFKHQVSSLINHEVARQYPLFEVRFVADYQVYTAGVSGHMDRVKEVCRMIERDLRAEIETQRDRITVLNRRVQELERTSEGCPRLE